MTALAVEMRMASGTPEYMPRQGAVFLVFNNGDPVEVALPAAPDGQHWVQKLDTAVTKPDYSPQQSPVIVAGASVAAFTLEPID
jgi:glycogen operon protein